MPENKVLLLTEREKFMVSESKGKLRILRILLAIRETSAPYNQFSLPWADKHNITICTYFASEITPPGTISLFEGNGSLTGFFRVLKAALKAKDYDVIHVHSPHLGFIFLMTALFFYRKLLRSTLITVHDSYQNYKLRNRLMFLPVFAGFRRVICCSWSSYDSFPALYKWLAGDRLRVIQNSLDIARVNRLAESIRQKPLQKSDFTIVAVSRLVGIKNPGSVVEAFEQSADQHSRLVYIGDGPLRDSLIAKSKTVGLENQVEFTGLIAREKVFEYLLNADLFISLSRGEGLPVSVLEAMACGCPVVLSDIPPHREIAKDIDFIPLVGPDDIAGFAREIRKFREMPVSERKAIGQKCRRLVEERFSLPVMHTAYEEVYAQISGRSVSSFSKTQAFKGIKP